MTNKARVTESVVELEEALEGVRRLLDYTLFHDSGLVEDADEAKQSPVVTAGKRAIAFLEALTTRSVSEDAGQGHTSPTPWEVREYGYEKIALLDANGAEVGFVHRRRDAEAIVAALNAAALPVEGTRNDRT